MENHPRPRRVFTSDLVTGCNNVTHLHSPKHAARTAKHIPPRSTVTSHNTYRTHVYNLQFTRHDPRKGNDCLNRGRLHYPKYPKYQCIRTQHITRQKPSNSSLGPHDGYLRTTKGLAGRPSHPGRRLSYRPPGSEPFVSWRLMEVRVGVLFFLVAYSCWRLWKSLVCYVVSWQDGRCGVLLSCFFLGRLNPRYPQGKRVRHLKAWTYIAAMFEREFRRG